MSDTIGHSVFSKTSVFIISICENIRLIWNNAQPPIFCGILILLFFGCSENEIEQTPPPKAPLETAESVPTSIHINPESVVLGTWGETFNFTAQVKDQFGNQMSATQVVWNSSDNTIARIGSNGKVTSIKPGNIKIKVSFNSLFAEALLEVKLQMNSQCPGPSGSPVRGVVAGLPSFIRIENAFDVQ